MAFALGVGLALAASWSCPRILRVASAQTAGPVTSAQAPPADAPAAAPSDPAAPPALPPSTDPLAQPPAPPTYPVDPPPPEPRAPGEPRATPVAPEAPEEMSEGRRIVVAYNTGFQWGLSPGVLVNSEKASFFLGLRLGYGFDTGRAILVPGVKLAGYFSDPNVYVGMPVLKLVYPIDRFAPFIEAGAGYGYIASTSVGRVDVPAQSGAALYAGVGFMLHFNWKFGLGVEGSYQKITGTDFRGFGVGPILALAF
jgi:hypothetical protein